jgi:hypothetical protein
MTTSARLRAPGDRALPADAEATAPNDLALVRAVLAAPPEVAARLFEKCEALWRHRRLDPELRGDLVRVAERIDPALAKQITAELDVATPATVLEAHASDLIKDELPALGGFPRRDIPEVSGPGEWIASDPRRLWGIVFEIARFTSDDRLIAESALGLAQTLGIDGHVAADIIGYALRDARELQAIAR